MMHTRSFTVLIVATTGIAAAHAEAQLAPIFQPGMVLQQGPATKLFGKANPGEHVTVTLGKVRVKGVADAAGNWMLSLKTPPAGGPYVLSVEGGTGTVQKLDDVLVGEVWICSGQSNMEWRAEWFNPRHFDVGDTNLPNVRFFQHPHRVSTSPQIGALGKWEHVNATNARNFSLIGFLFGRRLNQALNVPIGLIDSSWGGTPAESWIDIQTLDAKPELASLAKKFRDSANRDPDAERNYLAKIADWEKTAFDAGDATAWALPASEDAASWSAITVPGSFESQGANFDGIAWLRRTVDIPASLAGKDLILELGAIDDYDATYFNGEVVGKTGPTVPNSYAAPRTYTVPGRLVKAGPNTLAIRVIDTGGGGGPTSSPDVVRIGASGTWVPLSGVWQFRKEADFTDPALAAKIALPSAPVGLNDPWLPTSLYNGMIAPIAPFAARGAIWYQGESNVGRAAEYSVLFPSMIQAWRRLWNNPDFAFHYVQLSSYGPIGDSSTASGWAELREAQDAALALPGVGRAVAVDVGEPDNIHPIKKDVVAERLARAALAKTYRKRIEFEGPALKQLMLEGSTLRLKLKNANGLHTLDGKPLAGFAIAGIDGKYFPAEAKIDGSDVVLSSASVSRPVSVRYAWADSSPANLVNKDNLGMATFRTDRPAPVK